MWAEAGECEKNQVGGWLASWAAEPLPPWDTFAAACSLSFLWFAQSPPLLHSTLYFTSATHHTPPYGAQHSLFACVLQGFMFDSCMLSCKVRPQASQGGTAAEHGRHAGRG